ncbi:MAG: hypothetical protein AAF735_07990 [Myxococcota bacterium]
MNKEFVPRVFAVVLLALGGGCSAATVVAGSPDEEAFVVIKSTTQNYVYRCMAVEPTRPLCVRMRERMSR